MGDHSTAKEVLPSAGIDSYPDENMTGDTANNEKDSARSSLKGELQDESDRDSKDVLAGPDDRAAQATASPSGEEWISGIQLFTVMTGITLVIFLMLLDTSIVATAIPRITNQFHSLPDVAWYGSAYTLASCALQPLTGKFYTHFKSKWVFLAFFGLFEIGSLICALANTSNMLIIGRAVSGMGTSGMMNGALTIIAGAVPMHKRPFLMGGMMGFIQLGLVLGPLIGGAFTTYTTWRWCFYVNLPIGGLIAVLLVFTRIPEQRIKEKAMDVLPTLHKSLDLVGFVLFAPAAIMFLLALQWGGTKYAWNSSTVIGLFCGAIATWAVFLGWEYRLGNEAMIPFSLLRPRIAYCSYLATMSMFGHTLVVAYYIPIYFQAVRGHSALMSGVDLLPNILCQLVTGVLSGVLIGKLGYYLPWSVGGSVLISIGCGLLSMLTPTTHAADWAAFQALVGLGKGGSTQPPMLAVQNAFSPDDVSTAMAILTFTQTFGGAVFLAVAQVLFSEGLKALIPIYAPNVNPDDVIAAGATGFRAVVSAEDLPAVLVAYTKSIDRVFYLATALGCFQFVVSWGIGWKDVSKKKEKPKEHDQEKGEVIQKN